MNDDRGQSCDIAPLSQRQLGLRALGIKALADPHTRRELAVTGDSELLWAIGGGVVGAVIWQAAWSIWPGAGLLTLFIGFAVVSTLAGTLAWWLSLGAVRRRAFRRLVDVHLSTGRCAACGYELAGLAVEDDGCAVCPECGAAWRADRVGDSQAA